MGASHGCCWRKQIELSLHWIQLFISGAAGQITRTFDAVDYFNPGVMIEVVVDASPWGIGGFLIIDHAAVAWLADQITEFDVELLHIAVWDASSQQVM